MKKSFVPKNSNNASNVPDRTLRIKKECPAAGSLLSGKIKVEHRQGRQIVVVSILDQEQRTGQARHEVVGESGAKVPPVTRQKFNILAAHFGAFA